MMLIYYIPFHKKEKIIASFRCRDKQKFYIPVSKQNSPLVVLTMTGAYILGEFTKYSVYRCKIGELTKFIQYFSPNFSHLWEEVLVFEAIEICIGYKLINTVAAY